jgi:queuine/archaeosine tRNA-ribosyltransferase
LTVHNLHHYLDTLRRMRQSILLGRFAELREETLRFLATGEGA